MNLEKYIAIYFPEVYQLYQEIVNISSHSADKAGVDRVGNTIAAFMEKKGFSVECCANPISGNGVMITYDPRNQATGKRIALLAHMDTVHKKGTFLEPLFQERDGKVYGPGVLDCKGGIAVGILTMLALRDCRYPAPIKLILAPDEEVNFKYSGQPGIEFIKKNVCGADYVMVLESGTRNKLVTGRKGVVRYEVAVHGKAAHAGQSYDQGISAIKEACSKILAIEQHSDSNYGITYNCGIISGGEMQNSVPEFCKFDLDIRFKNQKQLQEAVATVERIVNTSFFPGTKSEMHLFSKRDAMEETPKNLALFQVIRKVSQQNGLEELENYVSGGASDACFSAAMGIPTVCGMGIAGSSQHTPREEAYIASLKQRSILLGKTMAELNGLCAQSTGGSI